MLTSRSGLRTLSDYPASNLGHTAHCRQFARLAHSRSLHSKGLRKPLRSIMEQQQTQKLNMKEKLEFLREDLQHLFDDKGITAESYDDVVDFKDPITKYSSIRGYLFNIAFLKRIFNPVFQLHDIRQTAPADITTRWTMTMELTLAKRTPLSRLWDPVIIFTGTSIYRFNPANGRINVHIDYWDSIKNQQYFSTEGFLDFLRQLGNSRPEPLGPVPQYTVLKRFKDFQVREYQPFELAVAESPSEKGTDSTQRTSTAAASTAVQPRAQFTVEQLTDMARTAGLGESVSTAAVFYTDEDPRPRLYRPEPTQDGTASSTSRHGGLYAAKAFKGYHPLAERAQQESDLPDRHEASGA